MDHTGHNCILFFLVALSKDTLEFGWCVGGCFVLAHELGSSVSRLCREQVLVPWRSHEGRWG